MLEFTLTNIDAIKAAYDPDLVEKALSTAINRVTAKGKTLISREIRDDYNVKAADVSRALTIRRARQGEAEAVLMYAGSRLGLHKFGPRVRTIAATPTHNRWGKRRKQTRVRVHKKDALTPAVGPNGNAGFTAPDGRVYARVGLAREKIVALMGPSIPQMVDKASVLDPLNQMLSTELNAEFSHNLEFYINQQMGVR